MSVDFDTLDVELDSRAEERGFELNSQQQEAVEKIRVFLDDPDQQFFGLYGYAGTGKTTTIHDALATTGRVVLSEPTHNIHEALTGFGRVVMSAPTHKAVGVLARMDQGTDFEFATIHRLLGCRKQYKDGEIFFAPDTSKKQAIHSFDVVVIDECSMIGETMWGWIREAVKGTGIKVIVMGDPMQLPPVKDGDTSPTFDLPCARLTKIMRHQGVIERAATAMREASNRKRLPVAEDASDEHGEIVNLGQSRFMERLMEDLDDSKVLAFTNAAVDWINDYIREALFGADAQPFEAGERLVLVETYDNDTAMLHTETEIRVDFAERSYYLGLDCWMLEVVDQQGGRHELYCLDDGQRPEYWRQLRAARDRGKAGGGWRSYYDLKEGFARVRPGWATTIHKSQGSTYDHVYLIQTNVLSTTRDRSLQKMLLYVGYSRAKKKLILS